MMIRRLACLVPVVVLAACGGALPAVAPVPIASPPEGALRSAATQPVSSHDLSAVEAPKNVVVVARLGDAQGVAAKLSRWTKIPFSPESLVKGRGAAEALDFTKPLDLVVAVGGTLSDPAPLLAISVAVKSLDIAKTAAARRGELIAVGNGVFRLVRAKEAKVPAPDSAGSGDPPEGAGPEDDDAPASEPLDGENCLLAPAYGSASYRLVCGDKPGSVDALLPFVTRGVTRMPEPSSGFHLEVTAPALHAPLQALRTEFNRKLRAPLALIPGARELFQAYDPFDFAFDSGGMSLDVTLDDGSAEATAKFTFRDNKSSWTRAFTSHPELAGAPPQAFLKLPDDALAASYFNGFDAALLEKGRALLPQVIEAVTAGDLDPSTGAAIGAAVRDTMALAVAPAVSASGVDLAGVVASAAALEAAKPTEAMALAQAAIRRAAGWQIVGVERPFVEVAPNVKAYVAIAQQFLNANANAKANALPKTAGKRSASPASPGGFKLTAAAPPADLPAATLHYQVTAVAQSGKTSKVASPRSDTVHLLVVPDGARTWLVGALDLPLAVTKAKRITQAASLGGSLASRSDLAPLIAKRTNAGGFITPIVIKLDAPFTWARRAADLDEPSEVSRRLRRAGSTDEQAPILFSITEVVPGTGSVGAFTFSMRFPKAALIGLMGITGSAF